MVHKKPSLFRNVRVFGLKQLCVHPEIKCPLQPLLLPNYLAIVIQNVNLPLLIKPTLLQRIVERMAETPRTPRPDNFFVANHFRRTDAPPQGALLSVLVDVFELRHSRVAGHHADVSGGDRGEDIFRVVVHVEDGDARDFQDAHGGLGS